MVLIAAAVVVAAAGVTAGAVLASGSGTGRSGTESFVATSSYPSGSPLAISLVGVFSASGTETETGRDRLLVRLPGGTFVGITRPQKAASSIDSSTCVLTIRQPGTFTTGNGTGRCRASQDRARINSRTRQLSGARATAPARRAAAPRECRAVSPGSCTAEARSRCHNCAPCRRSQQADGETPACHFRGFAGAEVSGRSSQAPRKAPGHLRTARSRRSARPGRLAPSAKAEITS